MGDFVFRVSVSRLVLLCLLPHFPQVSRTGNNLFPLTWRRQAPWQINLPATLTLSLPLLTHLGLLPMRKV